MDRQLIILTAASLQKYASAPAAASAGAAAAGNGEPTASAGGGAQQSMLDKIKNAPSAIYQDVKKGLQPMIGGLSAAKELLDADNDAFKMENDQKAGRLDPNGPAFNPDSASRLKTASLMKDNLIGTGEYGRQEQSRTSKPTRRAAVIASRPLQAAVNAGTSAAQASASSGLSGVKSAAMTAAGTAATNNIMPQMKNFKKWTDGSNVDTLGSLWEAKKNMADSGFTDANLGTTPAANAMSTLAGLPEVKAKLNKTDDYQIAGAAQDKTREVVNQQVAKYKPWVFGGGLLLGGLALGGAGLLGSALLKKRKPSAVPATAPAYQGDVSSQQRYLEEEQARGNYREFN